MADYQSNYSGTQIDDAIGKARRHETSKADIDGTYMDMSVGNADQLTAHVYTENKKPYTIRTSGRNADIGDSGNSEVGDREAVKKIIGGTVGFNQLVRNGDFSHGDDGTQYWSANAGTFVVTEGVARYTISSVTSATLGNSIKSTSNIKWHKDHKYLFAYTHRESKGDGTSANSGYIRFSYIASTVGIGGYTNTAWRRDYRVINQSETADNWYSIRLTDTNASPRAVDDWFEVKDVVLIDLTAMFGVAIANYVFTLESSTLGSGVAWLKSFGFIDKSYYEHDAGTPLSVKTSAHKMIGFNAFNVATGIAKLIGGCQYQITGTYSSLSFVDVNGDAKTITPDADGYFTPTNNGTLTVGGGTASSTCVHLVWDGERDGDFEAYSEHVYSLDSDVELRGIAKLDANNSLYYDGDEYEDDGTVIRRFGVVDMGTLDYYYGEFGENLFFVCDVNGVIKAPAANDIVANILCAKLTTVSGAKIYDDYPDFSIAIQSQDGSSTAGMMWITDSGYSDAAAFKAAMSGVMLVYEKNSPTTEEADAFINPQIVDDFGTEEFVDERDVPIPVGHVTQYTPNLRAKLEMSPNSPDDGDGDYIVRQTSGVNAYVKLTKELPAMPDADGTYVLKAICDGGEATLEWTLET